jgi:hypothetical protein
MQRSWRRHLFIYPEMLDDRKPARPLWANHGDDDELLACVVYTKVLLLPICWSHLKRVSGRDQMAVFSNSPLGEGANFDPCINVLTQVWSWPLGQGMKLAFHSSPEVHKYLPMSSYIFLADKIFRKKIPKCTNFSTGVTPGVHPWGSPLGFTPGVERKGERTTLGAIGRPFL